MAESRYKKLHSTVSVNISLQKSLLQKTIDTVQLAGVPYFIIDENLQKGTSFGERFGNAFNAIFEKGFENVIAIGSDCPSLTNNNLLLAKNYLEKGFMVSGPDQHQGVYLLGLTKKSFDGIVFARINWNSKNVQQELQHYFLLQDQQQIELVRLTDINSTSDLLFILKKEKNKFTNVLKECFQINHFVKRYIKDRYVNSSFFSDNILRGPPAYA